MEYLLRDQRKSWAVMLPWWQHCYRWWMSVCVCVCVCLSVWVCVTVRNCRLSPVCLEQETYTIRLGLRSSISYLPQSYLKKKKILSFIYPLVFPSMYDFLFLCKAKGDIWKNVRAALFHSSLFIQSLTDFKSLFSEILLNNHSSPLFSWKKSCLDILHRKLHRCFEWHEGE